MIGRAIGLVFFVTAIVAGCGSTTEIPNAADEFGNAVDSADATTPSSAQEIIEQEGLSETPDPLPDTELVSEIDVTSIAVYEGSLLDFLDLDQAREAAAITCMSAQAQEAGLPLDDVNVFETLTMRCESDATKNLAAGFASVGDGIERDPELTDCYIRSYIDLTNAIPVSEAVTLLEQDSSAVPEWYESIAATCGTDIATIEAHANS